MSTLFEHRDDDGDAMEVRRTALNNRTSLFFATDRHGVGLGRGDVIRLRDALNEWIGEAPQPVADTVTRSELVAAMARLRAELRVELRAELRPAAHPGTVCAPVITLNPMTPEEMWGPDCVACGHSSGVHTTLHGCGAAVQGTGSCPCAGLRGAS
jgi:hypothetical protein